MRNFSVLSSAVIPVDIEVNFCDGENGSNILAMTSTTCLTSLSSVFIREGPASLWSHLQSSEIPAYLLMFSVICERSAVVSIHLPTASGFLLFPTIPPGILLLLLIVSSID